MTPLFGAVLAVSVCSVSACSVSTSPNRAIGPNRAPIVLTMASPLSTPVELVGFANEVAALTDGSVHIVVKSGWRNNQVDYETRLIADVKAGKADLGVASARAFDSAGVLGFQALTAPLLITSYTAEEQVLGSPIVTGMLAGLDAAGLTGIGVLPSDLRRPLGVTGPLVKPADYAGRTIGTQQSDVADETMRALDATPVRFPVTQAIDGFDGVEQQISAIQGLQYDKVGKFLTANVAWWPRALVVFTTGKTLERLNSTQRQALKQAAASALHLSMAAVRAGEREALGDLCRAHRLTFDYATPNDLAALRAAVQPVYDSLQRDPQTKQAIAAIASTIHDISPELPPICDQQDQPPAAAGSSLLDGVYTMSTTFDDSPNDPDPVPENFGQWIFVIRSGHAAFTQAYKNSCTWGYGTLTVTGAQIEWTIADGGGISPTGAKNKPGEFFAFGWSLYRDTLTLSPVTGAISPANFRIKAWHRITTHPSTKYFNQHCPPPANALG
jgi:TRAP-type C4-dicarboxylate transport system substrate-binding protein